MKLNLWCGTDILPGYVNIDHVSLPGVDIVHDLENFPYPFEDNQFAEVKCFMVMEHIHNLTGMLGELIRICKPWAKIYINVPYFSSTNLRWDPTHVRWFNLNTFGWFHFNSLKNKSSLVVEKSKIHFFSNKWGFMKSAPHSIIIDWMINIFPRIYERFFAYILPSSEIHFLLTIKK